MTYISIRSIHCAFCYDNTAKVKVAMNFYINIFILFNVNICCKYILIRFIGKENAIHIKAIYRIIESKSYQKIAMLLMVRFQFHKTHDNIFGYSAHAATAL